MAGTSSLPLIPGPLVRIAKEWPQDVLLKEPEPNVQVVGDDMWVVLNHVPDESAPSTVILCCDLLTHDASTEKISRDLIVERIEVDLESWSIEYPRSAWWPP